MFRHITFVHIVNLCSIIMASPVHEKSRGSDLTDGLVQFDLLLALNSRNSHRTPDRVSIGAIDSRDGIAQRHVRALLANEGIAVGFSGSLSYGVSVPKEQAETARVLIERDAKKYGFWLWSAGKVEEPPKTDEGWTKRTIMMSRNGLYKRRAELPLVLKALLLKPWFSEAAKGMPIVRSVRWKIRRYLDIVITDPKHYNLANKRGFEIKERQGYDAEVTLSRTRQPSDETVLTYQVLSDGLHGF